ARREIESLANPLAASLLFTITRMPARSTEWRACGISWSRTRRAGFGGGGVYPGLPVDGPVEVTVGLAVEVPPPPDTPGGATGRPSGPSTLIVWRRLRTLPP